MNKLAHRNWQAICVPLMMFALAASAADIDLLEERDWKLVTSENFRVHSVLSEARTIELLRQLEVMRAALGDPGGDATFQAAVPTIIIALDNEADYQQIGVSYSTIGYFVADLRENAIVVLDNVDVQGVRTILHEYVHYLHRQHGRVVYPRWYEEGIAEYLSSSRVSDGVFEYGLPLQDRIAALTMSGWLPLEFVLDLGDIDELDDEQGDLYYSQSWLLVHYLHSLPDADRRIAENLQRYGKLVVEGADRVAAFEAAFSISVDALEVQLLKYLMADNFRTQSVTVNSSLPDFSPRVESLPQSQVEVALGRMAMRFGSDHAAEQWFTAALANPETRANAEAGLGTVYSSRGEVAQAEARFEAAIHLVSYDFRTWMDYAQFWAERVSESTDFDRREFYAKRLEEALRNAMSISAATPELNSLLGFSYLAQGKDVDEAIEFLLTASDQSPGDQSSRLLLANAYLYSDRARLAIQAAESVLSREHEANAITESARDIIDQANQLIDVTEQAGVH